MLGEWVVFWEPGTASSCVAVCSTRFLQNEGTFDPNKVFGIAWDIGGHVQHVGHNFLEIFASNAARLPRTPKNTSQPKRTETMKTSTMPSLFFGMDQIVNRCIDTYGTHCKP